jgi:hypothetical protein
MHPRQVLAVNADGIGDCSEERLGFIGGQRLEDPLADAHQRQRQAEAVAEHGGVARMRQAADEAPLTVLPIAALHHGIGGDVGGNFGAQGVGVDAEHLSPSIRRSGGVGGNVEHFDSDVKRASWQYVENNDAPYRWAAIMP